MLRLLPLLFMLLGCYSSPTEPQLNYTVKRGDSLAKIANAHGVSVDELRRWNDIDGNLIHPGDHLVIVGSHLDAERRKKTSKSRRKSKRSNQHSSPTSLKLPPLKACLKGPTIDNLSADEGFVTSAGLSLNQIRTSMNTILPSTLECAADTTTPSGTLLLEMTAACTGRVSGIQVLDPGPYEASFVTCVTQILRHTSFPAHDMPDGAVFDYPVRFSFGL